MTNLEKLIINHPVISAYDLALSCNKDPNELVEKDLDVYIGFSARIKALVPEDCSQAKLEEIIFSKYLKLPKYNSDWEWEDCQINEYE